MLSKLLGFFTGKGLTTYLYIALGVSLAANIAVGYLLKEAYQDTARVALRAKLDEVLDLNKRSFMAYQQQLAAERTRNTELLRRLEQSVQVVEEARAREEAAEATLESFVQGLEDRSAEYAEWSLRQLPPEVASGLRELGQ